MKTPPRVPFLLSVMFLTYCRPQTLTTQEKDSALDVGPAVAQTIKATGDHAFALMKWERNQWVKVSRVAPSTKGVTIIMHGFQLGDRKLSYEPTPEDINTQLGLRDLSKKDKYVPPPVAHLRPDLYALMWDSRAGNPWELEHLLMGGTMAFWGKASPGELKRVQNMMDNDPIEDETDTDFFKLLAAFYNDAFQGYQGPRPHLAGFSKGGHVAIKLTEMQLNGRAGHSSPGVLTLLDAYVGPAWANGDLGGKLIQGLRRIRKADIGIVNISTSGIYDVKLGLIPLADTRFRDRLAEEFGEIKIQRNLREKYTLSPENLQPITGFKPADQLIADHMRAPQVLIGSSLVCHPTMPTVNSSADDVLKAGKLQWNMLTPYEISDWIYDGVVTPECQANAAVY